MNGPTQLDCALLAAQCVYAVLVLTFFIVKRRSGGN